MLAVHLEQVGAHECEDSDAVLKDEVGVEDDAAGEDLERRVPGVRVGARPDTEHQELGVDLEKSTLTFSLLLLFNQSF